MSLEHGKPNLSVSYDYGKPPFETPESIDGIFMEIIFSDNPSFIEGCFSYRREFIVFNIQDFEVVPLLRRQGLGSTLMRAAAAQAKLLNTKYLTASLISEAAFRTQVGVFGFQNLNLETESQKSLNLSKEQVIRQYREHYRLVEEANKKGLPYPSGGIFCTSVDLSLIDTSTWTLPRLKI